MSGNETINTYGSGQVTAFTPSASDGPFSDEPPEQVGRMGAPAQAPGPGTRATRADRTTRRGPTRIALRPKHARHAAGGPKTGAGRDPGAGRYAHESLQVDGTRHIDRAGRDVLLVAKRFMVLAHGPDDVAAVDTASGALMRLRVPTPHPETPRLEPFDLVDAVLAPDPERDDLAQPEAVSISGFPVVLGPERKRRIRRWLRLLVAPSEPNLLGFAGTAAPYWEFRGMRPSLALVAPSLGPVLFRRTIDDTIWTRFGWSRYDNWLPVEDERTIACIRVAHRDRLTGKDLAMALGFRPRYLLIGLSAPREGRCFKTIMAFLPRP